MKKISMKLTSYFFIFVLLSLLLANTEAVNASAGAGILAYKDHGGHEFLPSDATTPPAVPADLAASPGDAQVNLTWTANSEPDLAGYNIYRSESPSVPLSSPINGVNLVSSPAYQDSEVTNGITYYYVVTAVDTSTNESQPSNEVNAMPSAPIQYTLTIASDHGTVTKNPDKTTYTEDDIVELTATANTGWSFANWTGGLTGTVNPGSVTIHGNTSVTATYSQNCYILTLGHTGQGSDPVASPSNSTGCPAGQYHSGESINLLGAAPLAGWQVGSWTGTNNDASTASTNTDTMPASAETVSVNYTQNCYILTLSHTGQGSDPVASPSNSTGCSAGQYHSGESINLSGAAPLAGWQIGSWTGTNNDASTASTNTDTMPSSAETISVNYTQTNYTLTIISANGTVVKSPDQATYHEGDVVQLTATANTGWSFADWTGGLSGTVNPGSVTIHGNTSVTATYSQNCYILTLGHTGQGSDPVASPSNSTGCPAGQYHSGESINLLGAAPLTGWQVGSWTGTNNDASTASTNIDTMPASAETVSVNYTQNCYVLTLSHTGQGSNPVASPSNSTGCSAGQYHSGESINLLGAAPLAGWQVGSWTGTNNDASTASTNTDTMPASAETVSVNYTQNCYILTLSHTGQGSDPVASPSNSTGCSAGQYHSGESINLSGAAPLAGWQIGSWTGTNNDASTASTNTDTMPSSAETISVNYTQTNYTLTIISANGTVVKSPDQATYHEGDVVQLTATANTGWSFADWTGGLSGTVNPGSVTIHGNTSVTANYNQNQYTLTITSAYGTVTKNPNKATYTYGEVVQLTATANSGRSFANWTGGLTGNANPGSVTIQGNSSVTANYGYIISGNAGGVGGATLAYTDGLSYTATAVASGNYSLTVTYNWSGTVTPSKDKCNFSPSSISYTNIISNTPNQNYTSICAPTLVAPSGSIGTNNNPTYTWNKVGNATWYDLWVNGPNGKILEQLYSAAAICNATTCSVTPTTILSGGAYTWWVDAYNSVLGYAPWSAGMNFTVTNPAVPGAATLVTPTGNIGTNYNPTYIWNPVAISTWYQLSVDGPNGNVLLVWYSSAQANCNGTTCSVTPATSLLGGAYTWKVQTWSQAGYGPWSTPMSFNTTLPSLPLATTLVTPTGDIGTNYNPTYTWNPVTGSTWYQFSVDGPSGNVFLQWYTSAQANCNSSTCSVTPAATLAGGAYTWKVQTWSPAGNGPWSSPMSFNTTVVGLPGAATLVTPTDNIGTNYNPTYTWNQVTGSTWYQFSVDGPSGNVILQWYTSAQANCNGSTCSVTPATTLAGGTAYTWKVQTWNSAGIGPWSSPMSFNTTLPSLPGAATLVTPTGNIGTNYNPTYTWNQVTDSTWYQFSVDGPSGNVFLQWYTSAQAACTGTTCSVTPATTLAGGVYTWKVQTWSPAGNGPWSTPMSFSTIVASLPGAATLVTPTGSIGTNHNPTYTWNQVTDSTWYYLWVNGPSGTLIQQWYTSAQANCNGTTCSVTPATTLAGGAYTWWIQTWNIAGTGPWSTAMPFTVSP